MNEQGNRKEGVKISKKDMKDKAVIKNESKKIDRQTKCVVWFGLVW